jgi:hypothetical protein
MVGIMNCKSINLTASSDLSGCNKKRKMIITVKKFGMIPAMQSGSEESVVAGLKETIAETVVGKLRHGKEVTVKGSGGIYPGRNFGGVSSGLILCNIFGS